MSELLSEIKKHIQVLDQVFSEWRVISISYDTDKPLNEFLTSIWCGFHFSLYSPWED